MEEPVNSFSQDIVAIVIILLCTLGLFRVFRQFKEFALRFSFFSWLQDERIGRFSKVITLIIAGVTTLYFVDKNLLELFTGLFYCGLMFQVAVLEAPPEPTWEEDEEDNDSLNPSHPEKLLTANSTVVGRLLKNQANSAFAIFRADCSRF